MSRLRRAAWFFPRARRGRALFRAATLSSVVVACPLASEVATVLPSAISWAPCSLSLRGLPTFSLGSIHVWKTFWIDFEPGIGPFSSPRLAEGVTIGLSGKQELQEADPLVFARLVDTKEHKVVGKPRRRHFPIGNHSVLGVTLYSMFSVVVVPRHAIMPKKRK